MAVIALLAVTVALLLGVLIAGSVYISYNALLHHAFAPSAAAAIIGAVLIALIALLMTAVIFYLKRIRIIPGQLAAMNSPLTSRAAGVAGAFIQGLKRH